MYLKKRKFSNFFTLNKFNTIENIMLNETVKKVYNSDVKKQIHNIHF